MKVKEIMTSNPVCCTPDSNLKEISQMMIDNDCGCIPVVESQSSKKPVGTVTDRDIAIRSFTGNKNPAEMKASDIMTSDVVTINPDTSIQQCSEVMKQNDIRRVLVVDNSGALCGIVAQADVAQYGPNPTLISDVVHDISESSPSPNQMSHSHTGDKKSFSMKDSLLSVNSLLPLAVGIGAGAAFKYFYNPGSGSEMMETKHHDIKKIKLTNLPNQSQCAVDEKSTNVPNRQTSMDNLSHQNTSESLKTEKDSGSNRETGRSATHH